jgi:hypothetical protein
LLGGIRKSLERLGLMKLPQFQKPPFLNFPWQFLRPSSIPDLFGFLA